MERRRRRPGVFLAEQMRVIGVGGGALEAVRDELLEAGDVAPEPLASARVSIARDPGGRGLRCRGPASMRRGRQSSRRLPGLRARVLIERFRLVANGCRLLDENREVFGIEIDVRHGRKERLDREHVDVAVARAQLRRAVRVHRNALGRVQQDVLQRRGRRVLAADAGENAARPFRGLLALVTEHAH